MWRATAADAPYVAHCMACGNPESHASVCLRHECPMHAADRLAALPDPADAHSSAPRLASLK